VSGCSPGFARHLDEKKEKPAMQQIITTTSTPQESPEPIQATPAEAVAEEPKQNSAQVKTLEKVEEAIQTSRALRPEIRPHAFVIMPFGRKKGADGSIYDFNAIYRELIKPTLESAGFESFRADEETTSGDILTDMFQELLLADLVLADMSIDNANVFYELGIRHALRKRGVVHIQAGRAYMPFDIFNVRTIPYHITPEGIPDPAFLEKDKAAIGRACRTTWASEPDRVHSPIFNLLTGLPEPDRMALRTPLATGFWREHNEWKQRLTIAQRQRRIGDILLLTEEISNPLIKEEAIGEAGRALQNMGRNELALQQYRKGLEINSRNLEFRQKEAIFLNRLGRVEEAIVKLESLLNDFPSDTEAMGTLGRIYKDMWTDSWKWIKDKEKRLQTSYDSYHWLVKAFRTYLKGFRYNLDDAYPGVNALTLGIILIDLANRFEDKKDPDPEIVEIRGLLPELRGTLLFSLEAKSQDDKTDYWTLVSLAELHVMTAERTQIVTRAYRKALTAARRNLFFLQSSMAQLEMLQLLGMRDEFVKAGLLTTREEIRRLRKEEEPENGATPKTPAKKVEGYVFLFTGYMVSNAFKAGNQFPPEKEKHIKAAIQNVLGKYKAGPDDLAIVAGMDAGSEILFVECCVERGIPVQAYFSTPEAPYLREFVSPGGEEWTERFYKMRNHPLVDEFYQPDHVGLPKEGDDVHERNNRWAFYSALTRGIDKVRLIAVWDGKSETAKDRDARLVKHMIDLMRETGGIIEQINSVKLTGSPIPDNPVTPPATNGSVPKSAARKSHKSGSKESNRPRSKKMPAD
jgi:tetratricopeptide (TPR) repeat protein